MTRFSCGLKYFFDQSSLNKQVGVKQLKPLDLFIDRQEIDNDNNLNN